MNRNLHRIIFNATRGERMAVAETASAHGCSGDSCGNTRGADRLGGSSPLAAALSSAAFGVLALLTPVHAQIRADAGAPGNQRPTVLQTANGVPQVNIQTPSAAGVSRNTYSQFDVDGKGAILNNGRANASTQLGGMVAANPWLATGSARVILNEVNSSNPSHLNGYVEVAGQRAEVIIANPSGISVAGGGFLNASGVTLTTGSAVINSGNLESFRVQRGQITVDGTGLDTGTADYTRILTRAMQVNASVWAKDLTVVTGANEVKALASGAAATAAPVPGTGAAPTFMLDVAAIGGMYAGKIFLVGTEAGLGVNNRGTLAAQQGDMVLRADGWLVNAGTIQARGALDIQTAGDITNSGGYIGSGGNLTAKVTLHPGRIINTAAGEITSEADLKLEADGLDNLATIHSVGDLAITLASGFESTMDLFAGGNAAITSTGTFTNKAKLVAGKTASVSALTVDNTATGQIAGAVGSSVTATDTITNRGLIDGGETRVKAATLTNIGTGRIYGDHVAIEAGSLTNDTETVAGERSDAVIAARQRLDIGVRELTNREHALIFSAGSASGAGVDALNIGRTLDAAGHATGSALAVNNNSATIESLGGLSLAAGALSNTNEHFATAVQQVGAITSVTEYSLGAGDVARGRDLSTHFLPSEVNLWDCEATCLSVQATGDTSDAWVRYVYTSTPYETVITQTDPGKIIAGARMDIQAGTVLNDRSHILAGGALNVTATSVQNVTVAGEHRVVNSGYAMSSWRDRHHGRDSSGTSFADYNPADTVTAITLTPSRLEPAASVAGQGAPAASVAAAAVQVVTAATAGSEILTVASAGPTRLPTSSLFKVNLDAASGYLVATDPRFTNLRQWLGSDYMLGLMASDPATVQKRLGDGFYEQRLINEQVAQLTGRRFLDGYANDEAQYRALMDSGVTFAKAWQLVPGVALTPEQMARLTSDIVWLVARPVLLPDGSTTMALVPQVYVQLKKGDLSPSGALLAGQSVNLDLSGDLTNSGSIAGRDVVVLNARNVNNLGGSVSGDAVGVFAEQDINIEGGSVTASRLLLAEAGGDLNVQSTTRDTTGRSGTRTGVDHVAGLYVTDPDGMLVASAGNDVNIVAGVLASGGGIDISAGRDVNLATVTTAESSSIRWNADNWRKEAATQEVGSQVSGGGDVRISAGNDLNARAASVNAGGALSATATRDVNITAGEDTRETEEASKHTSKGLLSKRTISTHDKIDETQAVGSSFGGESVYIGAGGDLAVKGSSVVSDAGTTLVAGGDVRIEAAQNSYSRDSERVDKKSGVFSGGGLGVTVGSRKLEVNQDSDSTTAAASTVGSIGGDVTIVAGKTYSQTGSDVLAPNGDVGIYAQDIRITEARETSSTVTEQKFRQSGLTVQITSPVLSAIETVQGMAEAAGNTSDARMKALAVANSAFAVNNALDAVEAGQGRTINDKPNQVERTNLDGTKTAETANAADKMGGINLSVSLGTSKSSSTTTQTTDTARGSTVSAGGDVTLNASGKGADSGILIRGSDITAGNDATLKAEGDIDLLAAQNTANLSGSNKSSSASVGLSVGTSGTGVTVSGSKGRGSQSGEDVTQTNTHVTAGKTATLQSGDDTTLKGALVKADTVKADVGGDLTIESLQDTSTYTSKQQNVSASVTMGAGAGGSISASGSKVNSDYASVVQQSGIRAGDGGFDVKVGEETDLKGGAIASTDKAVNEGRNSFSTGTLTTSDIENSASYKASGYSVSVGTGGGSTGLTGAGVGGASGHDGSTTQAGISNIAGNTAVRSTDAETGIRKIFDQEKVQKDIDAQVKITEAFGRNASAAWGQYANDKLASAIATGDEQTAQCWGPEGACRAAGHAVIGGLTGGAGGAAGAAASSITAPAVYNMLRELGVQEEIASGLTAAYGAGIGGVTGGAGGAAAGANEAGNNAAMAARLILAAVELGGPTLAQRCLASPTCVAAVGTAGVALLNGILNSAHDSGGEGPSLGDVNPSVFNGSDSALPADTYGTPPNGASPPPGGEDKNPAKDRSLNPDGELLGKDGVKMPSKTVLDRGSFRVDFENPNPGQRSGQIHIQSANEKYMYNVNTNALENLNGGSVPRSIQGLLDDPQVQQAINKALRYLGEAPVRF